MNKFLIPESYTGDSSMALGRDAVDTFRRFLAGAREMVVNAVGVPRCTREEYHEALMEIPRWRSGGMRWIL